MAATGKTPILLYGSTTATNAPSAGNLTNGPDGCEIAINVADKNLFFKDSGNVVNTVPIRQSSGSSDGWLSSTDWSTFNSKQPAGTYVTSVTGTAPVVSSGGATPAISMAAATTSVNGYLTSTDWTTFNNKQAALVSGTNIKTVGGNTLLGSGDVGTIGVGYGGTGKTSWTANGVLYASATNTLTNGTAFTFDGSANLTLGSDVATWATLRAIKNDYTAIAAYSTNSYFTQNYYYNGGNKFVGNGYAAIVHLDGTNGKINFQITDSNSSGAGAAASFYTLGYWDVTTKDFTVNSGNVVIGTSGKGIDFSATAGTGTSELLADYEEGTFTPAIVGGSTAGTGTYTTQIGRYTKIGREVFFNIVLVWTAHTGSGTSSYISGLPYTSVNVTGNDEPVKLNCSNYALTAANVMTGYVGYSSTNIILQQMPTGGGAIASLSLDTAASVWISGSYSVT